MTVDMRIGIYMAGIQSAMTARQLANIQSQSLKTKRKKRSGVGGAGAGEARMEAKVAELHESRRQALYLLGELSVRCTEVTTHTHTHTHTRRPALHFRPPSLSPSPAATASTTIASTTLSAATAANTTTTTVTTTTVPGV